MTGRDLCITFAGGGTSSFYQLGLMNRWRERLLPRVAVLSAVSAGAGVAAIMLSERQAEVGQLWQARSQNITKNFDWQRLLALERPTPHEAIYRDLLLHAFAGDGLERVRSQPFPVFVLASAFPRFLPGFAAALLGGGAHLLENVLRKQMLHPSFGRRLGFSPITFDARECRTAMELTDLILASSATPPFTAVGAFSGRRLLDGGIVDNAPAFQADGVPGRLRTLVLLTRHYPDARLGRQGSRLYLAPTAPLPLTTWDYTRPETLFEIIERGERDAEYYEARLTEFLDSSDCQ